MKKPDKKKSSSLPMPGESYNPQAEILAELRAKCPEIFSEGKIDQLKLKKALGEFVGDGRESYGLTWAGKSEVFRHIQESTTATLKPCRKESADFDSTGHVFIEGENLQVLKTLQKSYYGRIKMIYIDPPYNTGNDSFIYPDRFQESRDEYLKRAGAKDAEGHLTRDGMFQKNSRDNGHFHSNWLNMMYPRLFLARNLLRDDGVIFVSIDDNEVHNLRMIMNEIFGEESFVAVFPWRKRTAKSDVPFGVSQDYEWIIVYAKENFVAGKSGERKYYSSLDFQERWRLADLTTQRSKEERPNSYFEMINPRNGERYLPNPNRVWGVTKDTFDGYYKKGKIVFPGDYDFLGITRPAYRVFENEDKQKNQEKFGSEETRTAISTMLPADIGRTEDGTKEITGLFDVKAFNFPKPTSIIKFLINLDNDKNFVVLDFFAGSGTTAHAVMTLNAEDGGHRTCISVQMPEPCPEDSEARKAGYDTIADIAKERIRRAAKKIRTEKKDLPKDFDSGFKVFKLEDSNFKIWRSDHQTGEELQKQMKLFVDNIQKGARPEDVLYELILKSGRDLNVPIETKTWKKQEYSSVDGGKLIVFLEGKVSADFTDHVIGLRPEQVICLDGNFAGNDQLKTNTHLQMESAGIEFKVV